VHQIVKYFVNECNKFGPSEPSVQDFTKISQKYPVDHVVTLQNVG